MDQGKLVETIGEYRLLAKTQPNFANVHNILAWMLATAPDPRLRQPLEAGRAAQRAMELAP
jgi:hypothetical protein